MFPIAQLGTVAHNAYYLPRIGSAANAKFHLP